MERYHAVTLNDEQHEALSDLALEEHRRRISAGDTEGARQMMDIFSELRNADTLDDDEDDGDEA